ncbi:MAG: GntR family transcriptional regulator [Clostridia bacterium]|nr:GntR family transcriptional regulator [Clostridia bacterium]
MIGQGSKLNTLPQDLFIRLRNDILQGKFVAGSKLSEQQICDEYMVSRTPVREAFQKLELEGVIEIIPNRGAFVLKQTKQDIDDVYEIMKALESVAIRLAIERIDDETIKRLQELYELMEFYTVKADLEKLRSVNEEFHNTIYEATNNPMIMQTLSSCQTRVRNNQYRKEHGTDFLEEELAEHEAIFMAIVAKDRETAAAAAVRHIRNGKKRASI